METKLIFSLFKLIFLRWNSIQIILQLEGNKAEAWPCTTRTYGHTCELLAICDYTSVLHVYPSVLRSMLG